MKKSIFLIFGLMLAFNLAWAAEDDIAADALQAYSDAINETIEEDADLSDADAAAESPVSPYGIQSARIAKLLDERDSDDSEEEVQQQYASMHEEDGDDEDASTL